MNLDKLYEILGETTRQLRKGDEVEERKANSVNITEIYAMPHEDMVDGVEKVDLEYLVIGVNKEKAEKRKAELIELLKEYSQPARLASGPSYIEVGGEIGDQGAAFQLFALGKVLGLWDIITPKSLGITGETARTMAGAGFIMISGYKVEGAKKSWTTDDARALSFHGEDD